jgi:membrane-bound lytic murein transglycosylase B
MATGKKDILSNPVDAIGSVANFLSSSLGNKKGWDKDGFIAVEASPKRYKKNIKSSFKLKPYKELDLKVNLELDASKKYIQISLFPKDDTKEEYWLGDKNLYAITRYNPSSKYAMSVFLLSREFINIGN